MLGELVVSLCVDAYLFTSGQFLGVCESWQLCSWNRVAISKERRAVRLCFLLLFLGKSLFALRSMTFLSLELLIDMHFF